ncbi:MAG: hypothetical protein QOJ99_1278 [Bryobacterales bacterium]|jgi:hypothetical protein|nr:hypothetical protein [Bryobacterales bacterium]
MTNSALLNAPARIECVTSTDAGISCTDEKAYQVLNQKFVYDVRAKAPGESFRVSDISDDAGLQLGLSFVRSSGGENVRWAIRCGGAAGLMVVTAERQSDALKAGTLVDAELSDEKYKSADVVWR